MQDKVTLFVNLFLHLESVQKTQEEVQVGHSESAANPPHVTFLPPPSLLIFSCILYKEPIEL